MNFLLDNAAKLRAAWPLMSAEERQALLDSEVVSLATRYNFRAECDWRYHSGSVDMGTYYRAYNEHIADAMPFERVSLTAAEAQELGLIALQRFPRLAELLLRVNFGVAPPIQSPLEPESTQPV